VFSTSRKLILVSLSFLGLLAASAGCTGRCRTTSQEEFSLNESFSEDQLQSLIESSTEEVNRNTITCEYVCKNILLDLDGRFPVEVDDCSVEIVDMPPEDLSDQAGTVTCSGVAQVGICA